MAVRPTPHVITFARFCASRGWEAFYQSEMIWEYLFQIKTVAIIATKMVNNGYLVHVPVPDGFFRPSIRSRQRKPSVFYKPTPAGIRWMTEILDGYERYLANGGQDVIAQYRRELIEGFDY